jgi:hypothetical protein
MQQEPSARSFSHAELAEILIKHLDIHDGLWGVYIEFGFAAANVPVANEEEKGVFPASMAVVRTIGIQPFEGANNLTVDAAKVNPGRRTKARKSTSKTGKSRS